MVSVEGRSSCVISGFGSPPALLNAKLFIVVTPSGTVTIPLQAAPLFEVIAVFGMAKLPPPEHVMMLLLALACSISGATTTEPTGTKSVPTKTATSARATRARRRKRKRCGVTLRSCDTWLLWVKIGASTHSWRRMPYLESPCILIGARQMS